MAQTERRTTTVDNPYVIANPVLGMLNLLGAVGNDLLARDQADLAPLFPSKVLVSTKDIPACNVLFLYCALTSSAGVAGTSSSLRGVIKDARAHIVVIASGVEPGFSFREFGRGLDVGNDWPANIVITLDRKGDSFSRFFKKLFARMQAGVSMPLAWVELAPQGGGFQQDNPDTVFLAEAGHITFGPRKG